MRNRRNERILAAWIGITVCTGSVWSGPHAFIGARATGLGGTGAAAAHDATVQWHNPAVLGFMHQSLEENLPAETNLVGAGEAPEADTNAVPVETADTHVLEEAGSETNAVTEATNTVPVSESVTNLVDDGAAATNAVTDETGMMSADSVSANSVRTKAVQSETATEEPESVLFNEDPAQPVSGPFGPAVHESGPADEAGYSLLDNNGLSDRTFGWNIFDIGLGYSMTENMGRYLDILADIDFNNIDQVDTPQQVSDLVALAAALQGVSEPGNSFYVDANAGTSMRIGHFAFGVRLFGESAVRVDELDSANLGLDAADADAEILSVAAGDGSYPGGYSAQNLSGTQQSQLIGAGLSQASVDYLDYQLGLLLADGTLSQSDVGNAADLLAEIVGATGGGNALADNQTAVIARGFALTEVPVSYGRAINENLSLGITAKAMFGRVLGTRIWVFDDDNLDEAVQSVSDTESDTLTFGLDVGALYRIEHFQFAAVGHNLNRPTFDGYTDQVTVNGKVEDIVVPDVKMDPQVTVGAAFIPSERFLVEVNYDLLETGTLLEGYDLQHVSVGAELNLWALVLRIGAYNNLAESERDWVLTAGIGANLFGIRTDLGGAYSLDTAEYDGQEIPAEARIGLSLSLDY